MACNQRPIFASDTHRLRFKIGISTSLKLWRITLTFIPSIDNYAYKSDFSNFFSILFIKRLHYFCNHKWLHHLCNHNATKCFALLRFVLIFLFQIKSILVPIFILFFFLFILNMNVFLKIFWWRQNMRSLFTEHSNRKFYH